ncbi:MAG: helix-turn-helix domain-containing protein [Bacteroidales bacterium]|nr:helix-turn-helix domain-containing protein [Bacteroidales bacterium]
MNLTPNDEIEIMSKAKEDIVYIFKEVLTADEAAQYMGVKKSYLYKLTMRRQIPHYKPRGKMCYFKRAELEKWLTSCPVPTEEEIADRADKYLAGRKIIIV